jgi:hypothetical protein
MTGDMRNNGHIAALAGLAVAILVSIAAAAWIASLA